MPQEPNEEDVSKRRFTESDFTVAAFSLLLIVIGGMFLAVMVSLFVLDPTAFLYVIAFVAFYLLLVVVARHRRLKGC